MELIDFTKTLFSCPFRLSPENGHAFFSDFDGGSKVATLSYFV